MDERQKQQTLLETAALLQRRGYQVANGFPGPDGRPQWLVSSGNGALVGMLRIDYPYHLFLMNGMVMEACKVRDQRQAVPAQVANPYLQGSQAPAASPAQSGPHTGRMQYGSGQRQPAARSENQYNQPRLGQRNVGQNLPAATRAPSRAGPDQSNQQPSTRRSYNVPSQPQVWTGQTEPWASSQGPASVPSAPGHNQFNPDSTSQGQVQPPSVPGHRQVNPNPVRQRGRGPAGTVSNPNATIRNPIAAQPTPAPWPPGLLGTLAAWPQALVTTSGISGEIDAWVTGQQKLFAGYLGVLKLVSREDEELSNALAQLLTPAPDATGLFRVENIFGSGTVFVSSDGSGQPFNPSSWPILTRASLKANSGNGWQVNDKTGCIHVTEELDKAKFATSRFYNKLRQEVCYAYTCNIENASESSAEKISIDDLIYDYDEEQKVADSFSKLGYPVLSPSLPKPETSLNLGDRNSKFIMNVNRVPWYLGVAQFNVEGKLKVAESIKGPRAGNRRYLIAKGAANMSGPIPEGMQYHPKTEIDMHPIPGKSVNGMRLDKLFFEYSKLCLRTSELARTADSFYQARMWTLTREADDPSKQCTLSILDIGVRAPSTPYRDIGFINHPEPAYNEAVANIKAVRCFVALVPDVLDSDLQSEGPLINVVNLQDIHPVNGELHIIYLLHRKGKYYTHHVFENVKLVDVDISLESDFARRFNPGWQGAKALHERANEEFWKAERAQFVDSFGSIVSSDEPTQSGTGFERMDSVDVTRGCGKSVNGKNQLVRGMRGFYNEFWKRVIDPTRAEDPEQREMFKRWQPFYSHEYKERRYLAEPLSNFKRHEVHVVRVADYLRECDRTARNTITGSIANTTSRAFLSGVATIRQSFLGAPVVLLESSMIQVSVPDKRIRCVIYDFEGVANLGTRYYAAYSERQAMAYFRQTLDLQLREGEKLPERLYCPQYVGHSASQREKCREEVLKEEKDIKDVIFRDYRFREGNEEVTVDSVGSITERWFYFVNSLDTGGELKVGVANLPFNCRAATLHCQNLSEVFVHKPLAEIDSSCKVEWDAGLHSKQSESTKYQIYGTVWDNEADRQQVVGSLGGESKLQVAESSFSLSGEKKGHTIVFLNNVDYDDISTQHKHILSLGRSVLSVSLCRPGSRDLNHNVRAIAVPVLDLCKGYPVQGFYRVLKLDCEKMSDNGMNAVQNRTDGILRKTKDPSVVPIIPQPGNSNNPANSTTTRRRKFRREPCEEENSAQMTTLAAVFSSLSTLAAASFLAQIY
ncbi:hypothetical protein HDE_03485 [Halotydeus destructor]|nr:hypothetical protein HDE_03485 [Halotydeus destructor]